MKLILILYCCSFLATVISARNAPSVFSNDLYLKANDADSEEIASINRKVQIKPFLNISIYLFMIRKDLT